MVQHKPEIIGPAQTWNCWFCTNLKLLVQNQPKIVGSAPTWNCWFCNNLKWLVQHQSEIVGSAPTWNRWLMANPNIWSSWFIFSLFSSGFPEALGCCLQGTYRIFFRFVQSTLDLSVSFRKITQPRHVKCFPSRH